MILIPAEGAESAARALWGDLSHFEVLASRQGDPKAEPVAAEVMKLPRTDSPPLSEDAEERAAILEYEQGFPRDVAERLAMMAEAQEPNPATFSVRALFR